MEMMGMDAEMTTSPDCYATDDTFLQNLAYCISVKCSSTSIWEVEQWWSKEAVGGEPHQPAPKESFQEALASIKTVSTREMVSGDPLYAYNRTMFVNEEDYTGNFNGQAAFEGAEVTHERFGFVLTSQHCLLCTDYNFTG